MAELLADGTGPLPLWEPLMSKGRHQLRGANWERQPCRSARANTSGW